MLVRIYTGHTGLEKSIEGSLPFLWFKRLCFSFFLIILSLDSLDATKARNCQKGQQDNMNYFKWYVGRPLHRCPLGVVTLISHPVVRTRTHKRTQQSESGPVRHSSNKRTIRVSHFPLISITQLMNKESLVLLIPYNCICPLSSLSDLRAMPLGYMALSSPRLSVSHHSQ